MSKSKDYKQELRDLQIGLVRYQEWAAETGTKAVIVFEGRDAAGKDGTIARITEHLTARRTRAIALPKPSDRDRTEWYFQRYVHYLPAAGDLIIFNRSWYNRAGVEPVMGFCTRREHEDFLRDAPAFENMLGEAKIRLVKLWLDISRKEQAVRLDARRNDPLKALKVSDLDGEAQKRWKDYSKARNEMLLRTSTAMAPWTLRPHRPQEAGAAQHHPPPAAHHRPARDLARRAAARPRRALPLRGKGADRRAPGGVAARAWTSSCCTARRRWAS